MGTRPSSGKEVELRAVICLKLPKGEAAVGPRLSAVDALFLSLVARPRSASRAPYTTGLIPPPPLAGPCPPWYSETFTKHIIIC